LRKYRRLRRGPVSVPGHVYHGKGLGHITSSLGTLGVCRYDCLPALPPPAGSTRPDITTGAESGDGRVHRTGRVNAPHPLLLECPSFGAGEHGVVDVPITLEHGVVVSQRHGGTVA
jgi:hypothetical protein